jgi:hypothetical protein
VAQADLDGELASVLAERHELEPEPHRPHSRIGEEAAPMLLVRRPEPLGQENLEGLAAELVPLVAEHLLEPAVGPYDPPGTVGHHDAEWRGFENGIRVRSRVVDQLLRAHASARRSGPIRPALSRRASPGGLARLRLAVRHLGDILRVSDPRRQAGPTLRQPRCAGLATTLHGIGKLWMPGATGIGPYSGKETVGGVVWIVSWLVLHPALRAREMNLARWLVIFLIGIGIATTLLWPPVYTFLAHH